MKRTNHRWNRRGRLHSLWSLLFTGVMIIAILGTSAGTGSPGSPVPVYGALEQSDRADEADSEPAAAEQEAGAGGETEAMQQDTDPDQEAEAMKQDTGSGQETEEIIEETGGESEDVREEQGTDTAADAADISETTSAESASGETASEEPAGPGASNIEEPEDTVNEEGRREADSEGKSKESLNDKSVPGTNTDEARTDQSDPAGEGPDPSDSGSAPGESSDEEPVVPEPGYEDLTESENRRAFLSATSGALRAAASTLSNAKVISKGDEIDYDKLGFTTGSDGHIDHTTPIRIRDENSNTYTGICVVPDDRGWLKGDVLPDVRRVTDAVLIKLYYYTMLDDHGLKLAQSRGFGDISEEASMAACHEAMSKRYAQLAGIEYDRPNVNSTLKSLVKAYENDVSSLPLPDPAKVFVYVNARKRVDGHWRQAYVFGRSEEEETSNVTLVKVCSDSDMRAAFSQYCLHQTESGSPVTFRLYTDAACTRKADVYADEDRTQLLDPIPVGRTSVSGLSNRTVFYCDPGTYYLKELSTPKGYQPAAAPFGPYTLEEGKGRTIQIPNTPRYAKAGIYKVDSRTKEPVSGAQFGLYSEREDAVNEEKPDAVLTTGNDGRSGTADVLAGRVYYVREISAPYGYKPDKTLRQLNAAAGFTQAVWTEISNTPIEGRVQVKKISADPDADHSPYSLAGAIYTLYNSSGKAVASMKTGADGASDVVTVRIGKYTLKETAPSPGFLLDPKTYEIEVRENELTNVSSVEEPRKGKIVVHKYSSEEKEKKEPDTMPIAGAVYSLFLTEEDARDERGAAGTFVIKEDGSSNIVEMLAGKTYYVKETKTPEGYLPDETIHSVRVRDFEEIVRAESEDRLIFGGVRIAKLDAETGKGAPLGGATLEGAVFKIFNDGDLSVYADGKKVLPGAEALTLETDEQGIAKTADRSLSYGSYRIEEIRPPEGYTGKGAEPVRFRIREDGVIVDLAEKRETSIQNEVMRGDFSLRKLNGNTQRRMAGVTFEISGYDRAGNVIETHRFTTDVNGNYESTADWHQKDKSRASLSLPEGGDSAGPEQGRLWFGKDSSESYFSSGSHTDPAGALPYGDYHIEEIEGENNRGMKMFSEDFSVYADHQMIELGNIEDTLKPELATELVDEDGDHYADQTGMVTLTDTVEYSGMEDHIGEEVTFRGILYVRESGKPLKIDGRTIEAVRVKKLLAPSGTVQLRFTFDATKAEGKTLVCYEYVYEGDVSEIVSGPDEKASEDPENSLKGREIASHEDPDDQAQTVHLVRIETRAEDSLTGAHIGYADHDTITVDHVACVGLVPGETYRVTGLLVDKSTGRGLRDSRGKEITAEASFTAKSEEETVDLTFKYDASLIRGTTAVAFERLYLKGAPETDIPEKETPIASHEDPDDEDQSIHYPEIRTVATGEDGTGKVITVGDRSAVVDHVFWKNLVPGRPYRLQGVLVYKENGKPVTAGQKEVTAQTVFVPETADGDLKLTFTVDASVLSDENSAGGDGQDTIEGFRAVVFEELYLLPSGQDPQTGETEEDKPEIPDEGILIASHSDLEDEEQTICLKPDVPEEPDQPSEPDQPEKKPRDEKDKEPQNGTGSKRRIRPASPDTVPLSSSSPRTGDETSIASFLIPAVLAAACAAGILFGRKKK